MMAFEALLELAYVTSTPVSLGKASHMAKPDVGRKSAASYRQALKIIWRRVEAHRPFIRRGERVIAKYNTPSRALVRIFWD